MALWLPAKSGDQSPNDIERVDRFVGLPVAVKQQLPHVLQLFKYPEKLSDIDRAQQAIMMGRLVTKAGVMSLGPNVFGSFDLHAVERIGNDFVALPQPKAAVDPETKEPKESGGIVFSVFDLGRMSVKSYLYGYVLNPDEEPWTVDAFGLENLSKQNRYGNVIAQVDRMIAPGQNLVSIDPDSGQMRLR